MISTVTSKMCLAELSEGPIRDSNEVVFTEDHSFLLNQTYGVASGQTSTIDLDASGSVTSVLGMTIINLDTATDLLVSYSDTNGAVTVEVPYYGSGKINWITVGDVDPTVDLVIAPAAAAAVTFKVILLCD
jgi:hypothetical protein